MPAQDTIAIITNRTQTGERIMRTLSGARHRFVLVAANQQTLDELSTIREGQREKDIEFLSCMKDACWESDLVILDLECSQERKEASKLIQEVSVQKVVISFEERNEARTEFDKLFEWLPHSKVVVVEKKGDEDIWVLGGTQREALDTASAFLQEAGFKTEENISFFTHIKNN